MILHRCLIEKLFVMDADLSVYLLIDSSPQRNGMELFAVSADLVWGDRYERRLWPLITIEHHMLDAARKSIAPMWLVWLMVGPCIKRVNLFRWKVKAILSDMGVEHRIAKMNDFTAEFSNSLTRSLSPLDMSRIPFYSHCVCNCVGGDTFGTVNCSEPYRPLIGFQSG